MSLQHARKKPLSTALTAIAVAAGIALIGFQLLFVRINGSIAAEPMDGCNANVGGVEVFIYNETKTAPTILKTKIAAQDHLAQMQERHDQLVEISQHATGSSTLPGGVVTDMAMNVMTLGIWNVARKAQDRGMARWAAKRLNWGIAHWPTAGYFLDALPQSALVATATTDERGSFQVILPRHQSYLVAAKTNYNFPPDADLKRNIRNRSHRSIEYRPPRPGCFWLVRLQPAKFGDTRLALTDSNMMNTGHQQSIVKASLYSWKPDRD